MDFLEAWQDARPLRTEGFFPHLLNKAEMRLKTTLWVFFVCKKGLLRHRKRKKRGMDFVSRIEKRTEQL